MMLSLLETMLVMHLLGKDAESQDDDEDGWNKQGKANSEEGEIEHKFYKPRALSLLLNS